MIPQAEEWGSTRKAAFTLSNGEQTSDITIQNIGLNSGSPQDDTQETRQRVPDGFSGTTIHVIHVQLVFQILGYSLGYRFRVPRWAHTPKVASFHPAQGFPS